MEGFSKVVEDAWWEGPCDESNAMMNMMIKLKHIKIKIQEWNKKNMLSAKNVKAKYKDELEALEAIIDKGDGNVEVELESDVFNEEIKRTVWDCGIDKSPSPDGFTFGCNSSFIALIPKISDTNTVKDFRPISPIGSLYKIVAKILVNRLVSVLGDIVNEVQSPFIAGRSSRGSIIINGSPTKEFQFFKGLKQGQWCDGNITTLVHVLECLYRASGLRINMSKSKIMGVLVDSNKVKCAASKLGCLILKTPFLYLGSKVGGSMSRVHTWNEVVDRVKNRLSKWKMKTLLIGGRGLMFKWMWRFYTQNTTLWVWVIKAIHGDDRKVEGYVKDGAKSCWLSIVNEINSLKNKGINLLDFMHVKLGNGDKIAFWEDIWIEGKVLKNRYPRIYSLETCKLITMGMKLAQISLDSSFRRVLRGGVEQEQFDELSSLVHDVTLTPMSDR
nr:RNA-directed DNA polymerase, eukaryota, reverse transcriptase zinc-binding domain protein [Tanacetum cinerariifolium]